MTTQTLAGRWRGREVLVLGDALLDGWLVGTPRRLCREAPVPVIAVDSTELACGGAANTAVNLAALGARPTLLGAVGTDADGRRLRGLLADAGVVDRLVEVAGRRTVSKRRLVAAGQILVRLDRGDTGPLPPDAVAGLRDRLAAAVADGPPRAVLVCDYSAGTVGPTLREWLVAHRAELPTLVVDAHQPGLWRQTLPTLVTPSYAEAARVLGEVGDVREAGRFEPGWYTEAGSGAGWESRAGPDTRAGADTRAGPDSRADSVVRHADRLLDLTGARIVAVTLDVDGVAVVARDGTALRTYADPVPGAQTAGAGDAYAAAFTLALTEGASLAFAAETAQRAATVATRRGGTAVCSVGELLATGMAGPRVVDAAQLAGRIAAYRTAGRRVVFTNGCFDMLHRGHVAYLNQAKRLGDVLIVAVNSDASVRRIKGPGRPVNPQGDRVAVLAALSCVDHVVVFDEESPVRLIEIVRPDVYVKGGDYTPEMLPERPLVERFGGEVRILDYVPDRSTTAIIDRIRSTA